MDYASATTANKATIVAVAGGSGSGKTTFVRRLVNKLGAEEVLVLELDHYYRDLSHLSPKDRDAVNYDHPDALELDLLYAHMESLAKGQAIARPIYNFATHTRAPQTLLLEARPIVVIDGLFALYDARVNHISDLKIFIEAAQDLRLSRRIRRDLQERGRSLELTLNQYFDTVRPMHERYIEPTRLMADLVVPWHHYNDRAVSYIAESLERRISLKP